MAIWERWKICCMPHHWPTFLSVCTSNCCNIQSDSDSLFPYVWWHTNCWACFDCEISIILLFVWQSVTHFSFLLRKEQAGERVQTANPVKTTPSIANVATPPPGGTPLDILRGRGPCMLMMMFLFLMNTCVKFNSIITINTQIIQWKTKNNSTVWQLHMYVSIWWWQVMKIAHFPCVWWTRAENSSHPLGHPIHGSEYCYLSIYAYYNVILFR